ncbi:MULTISPECIES: type IV conjugative transfer system lipoprotein TraV [unclassified Variovorax]|uniref:type IV conjugative transfer system lipoprotein TraV n=1 Tax=unclassified Variovorax TaxID=663243 RepID=UPI00076DED0B|nr:MULTISPECIES: type IV conjugative transfer system lipoprotein TraV [unclassified Variovorax]KWT98323.1 hypothetical protein APY03_0458 [Variovorax sp. WDL1]PNG50022.1 hypothetical protein CHC06_05603 [Variovorax sp. B2]PNG50894.1 hypothetical protein CHC07_05508 [Variovorax sp. B4]VTU41500.1 type IV conjugative transfer system protein TraV [Variovorax sp. SRS16]VTU41530.1 type IV conjugative transfer system protein TraV [Variovorax sp. PBL-E5]
MKRLLIAASVTALLSACAGLGHVEYECALADVPAAKCASMEDAYKLSTKGKGAGNHKQSVFESQPRTAKTGEQSPEAAQPFFRGEASNMPDAAQQGLPVFKQPKVMRVWVAPYVDADGNLRSGEYTYFATPGAWNYGSLTKPGAAAAGGMFEPTKPNQLGFTPKEVNSTNRATTPSGPSKPPESKAATGTTTSSAPAPSTSNGITQPYQRLN